MYLRNLYNFFKEINQYYDPQILQVIQAKYKMHYPLSP